MKALLLPSPLPIGTLSVAALPALLVDRWIGERWRDMPEHATIGRSIRDAQARVLAGFASGDVQAQLYRSGSADRFSMPCEWWAARGASALLSGCFTAFAVQEALADQDTAARFEGFLLVVDDGQARAWLRRDAQARVGRRSKAEPRFVSGPALREWCAGCIDRGLTQKATVEASKRAFPGRVVPGRPTIRRVFNELHEQRFGVSPPSGKPKQSRR